MEYYETLGSPAKRRKLSDRHRSYSRVSVNKQTKSELPMQETSLLQCSNTKDIKNNKRVKFDTRVPLQQGSSINMFKDKILLPREPIQSHLPVINEKEGIQYSSPKTKINTENFLPIISDNQKKGKGNFTNKSRSTKNVLKTIGTSLPHNKNKNAFENKNATDTLTSFSKLLCPPDSEEEASFWTSIRKSVPNKAKLHSDKKDALTEGRILSRNMGVESNIVRKTSILLASNKTDVIVTPKISLKENKLNKKIKPFHKSKIPKLLSKNLINQKKSSLLNKLMIQDHNLNISINSVAEMRAVENLSKTDNPISNFGIGPIKAQKNVQAEIQSESNVSKVPQKTKINVPNKPSKSKVSFIDPLVTSNRSKVHMTRELKLLLDQNKSFGSDFTSDLVVKPELSRRSSLRKVKETNESPQIYSIKSTKEEKNVKPKKHIYKQNKMLKTAIAHNSKRVSLKRKMLNNIQATATSKPTEVKNNQNNNSTEQVTQPITNVTVTVNKPNISMERKSRYTKTTANIAVTKSQEGKDFSAEDENIVENQLVPNEKTIKKDRYTKQSTIQTDQLLSEKSETNAIGNNVQNIEESNSLTQIKHIETAVSLDYTKDAARNMLKESNNQKGVIKVNPRGETWSPGLKHVILDSADNIPAIGVRMMVDIPYNGKSIQLECLADYALICSNYKPIPGTDGNVVYGNGLHTAMNDICSGNIEMNPNSSKGIQTPKRHHLIFCVMKGTVIFTIRHAKKKVSTGAHFFVPCGISYNIENMGTEKAVLSFFKITKGCIALDRPT